MTKVKDLKVAWTLRTGDFKTDNDSGETPIRLRQLKLAITCLSVQLTNS